MKILVIRFSSIGDIVLTSPILRCLKKQLPQCELHYLTKKTYLPLLSNNPYIDQLHLLSENEKHTLASLKKEAFDVVIDLHHNVRTFRIKNYLKTKAYSFPKLNIKKFLLTQFHINKLPKKHVVDRYFEAVKALGVKNDLKGIDYFLAESDHINTEEVGFSGEFIAVAIGAQFATKRLPNEKLIEILDGINEPIVLLGGKEDVKNGEIIKVALPRQKVINSCGKLTINQSASLVSQAKVLLSHDTGLMHIASAFETPIVLVWGNTVPQFGMYPYRENSATIKTHQVDNLSCRPCSKIGYSKCPKKHFRCMQLHDSEKIKHDITA